MTVHWVDDEAEDLPQPPKRRVPPWAWWTSGAVIVAVVSTVAIAQSSGGSHHAASAPIASRSPHPTYALSTTSATTPTSSASTPTPATAPLVVSLGHPLLGVTTGWDLFARGPGVVVRVEMATGRVTQTLVPGLLSGGGVAFLSGPHNVIVRPQDAVTGYIVPDGKPAGTLGGVLGRGGEVFPGPQPGQVWVQESTDTLETPTPRLYDLGTDQPIGSGPVAPQALGQPFSSDGSGYLLYNGTGGVYDVRPNGVHRVTTGAVIAVGASSWLTEECDTEFRCSLVVVDRLSGVRSTLSPATSSNIFLPGTIAPDGQFAAYLGQTSTGDDTVHIVDLNTGADRDTRLRVPDGTFGSDPLAWAPGGHLLLYVDADQTIHSFDPAGGGSHPLLSLRLPALTQLTIRPAP